MKTFTTRWHGSTGAAVLAGVSLTGIGIKDTAKLQFRQANHFCEAAALVLQGQLIVVEDHWVQAALEAAQHLRGPLVSQAADVIHLDLRAKVDGAVCAERLEVQRGFAALHIAVVQGQAREVAVQLQEHRMPASIINGPARNSQDSRATSAVQLEPEFAIDNLQEENRNQSASGAQLSHNTLSLRIWEHREPLDSVCTLLKLLSYMTLKQQKVVHLSWTKKKKKGGKYQLTLNLPKANYCRKTKNTEYHMGA